MYTDSDILDLFTCLQGVGLAETAYEEAERLRTEARKEYGQSIAPLLGMTKWLLEKRIPHTYALTLRLSPTTNLMTTTLFPVVRGHVLFTPSVLSIVEFELDFSPKVLSIHYFSSLKGLKQGLLDLNKTYPTINPDKYTFLDIV